VLNGEENVMSYYERRFEGCGKCRHHPCVGVTVTFHIFGGFCNAYLLSCVCRLILDVCLVLD